MQACSIVFSEGFDENILVAAQQGLPGHHPPRCVQAATTHGQQKLFSSAAAGLTVGWLVGRLDGCAAGRLPG